MFIALVAFVILKLNRINMTHQLTLSSFLSFVMNSLSFVLHLYWEYVQIIKRVPDNGFSRRTMYIWYLCFYYVVTSWYTIISLVCYIICNWPVLLYSISLIYQTETGYTM